MMTIKQRLDTLRKEMKTFGIDAFIIPANDPHQSEYVADCWSNRTYFSGFTGSAGLLVVLQNYAALWTDSRYFLQAETELIDTGITLHKQQVQHAPEHVNWLEGILEHNSNVGVEASLFSVKQIAFMQSNFEDKNIKIKNVEGLTNKVWIDRPPLPDSIAYEHEIKYTGQSRDDKIAKIRHYMGSVGAQHYFVSALDEIAWLLNIRAWDIDFTPVALSYLLVSETNVYWFVQDFKVSDQLKVILSNSNVEILDYYAIADFLGNLSINDTLYVDGAHLSWNFHSIIKCNITIGQSAIMPLMAIKNKTEIAHFKDVMVKDGIALTHFFKWLEETVEKQAIRETEVAEKLTFFRSQQLDYVGDSFASIVGYKSNGAIVHYRAEKESCAKILNNGMLLVDSGGQYLNGTTDITRMMCFDEPTDDQKKHYTLVLKGNIALQTVHFPKGTTGVQLDVLARMHLWNSGLNYGHGTGHGVGFFLRVHEPPQGFAESTTTLRGSTVLEENTITSNEPGFYKTGAYGIRIENLMLCVPSHKNENFLAFEAITLFPIETKLIDKTILTNKEKDWLNNYHERVYASISPYLEESEKKWLFEKCQAI